MKRKTPAVIELRLLRPGVYVADNGYCVRRAPAGGWDVFRSTGAFIGWVFQRSEARGLIHEDANDRRRECRQNPD